MDQNYVYATASVIAGYIGLNVFRKGFDPFAPIWLFLVGYFQVYVLQAITHRDYALEARGLEVVTAANFRALWALVWFLAVYHCGLPRLLSKALPSPPQRWSVPLISGMAPLLVAWGLICAGVVMATGANDAISPEASLFRQFPIMMLVAAILLIVTGRSATGAPAAMGWAGIGVSVAYVIIWMFNGKRSHPLFGVLATICAFYVTKGKRPSKMVLAVTAILGALVVSLAIGWRNNKNYEMSFAGFSQYVSEFDPSMILVNMNLKTREDLEGSMKDEAPNYETEEYGGFLLMLDTVPMKSEYDYGASYLRLVSTYIPRMIWHDKPIYGREQWIKAWIAGSTSKRDEDFTGPAIGLLGATQLNGGAEGTAIVLAVLALLIRTAYDYFRRYSTRPWVQAWWSLTYYNAWLMTVNDDPFVWFYYVYGHTTLPPMAFLFIVNKFSAPALPATDARGGPGGLPAAGVPVAPRPI